MAVTQRGPQREADLMRLIQVRLSEAGHRVHRNNVGMARTEDGTTIRFGLGVGSSDLIGWTRTGKFLAVEVKTPTGRVTPEQAAFLGAVSLAGGIGVVMRSTDLPPELL
jgi:hypothetical protein